MVPYKICEEEFPRMFVLTDGIYPPYSRFVGGVKSPITEAEKKFTAWQESARKDIERAFGVIQGCWKFTARPIPLMAVKTISARIATCMMLHNMLVSDRVMDGDVYARYSPSNSLEDCYRDLEEVSVAAANAGEHLLPEQENEESDDEDTNSVEDDDDYDGGDYDMGLQGAQQDAGGALNAEQINLFKDLENREENARLKSALKEFWLSHRRRF